MSQKEMLDKKTVNFKKIGIIVTLIVLIFSIFQIGATYAAGETFTVTNVQIKEKSGTAEVNSLEYNQNIISSDLTMYTVGDYVTYKLKIKNNDSDDYIIKTITDNNKNEYIVYEYDDYHGTKLGANKEFEFEITEKYANAIEDISQRVQTTNVIIDFTLENDKGDIIETGVEITPDTTETRMANVVVRYLNPRTGDNIEIYFALAIISFVILLMLITNKPKSKHGKRFLSTLLILTLIFPSISRAYSGTSYISFENTVSVKSLLKITYGLDGNEKEKIVNYGEPLGEELEEPEKEGYEFIGWEKEDGTDFNPDEPITDDINLTPKYAPIEYTISYDLNGGTLENENPTTYTIEDEIQLYNPTRTGYAFLGWTGTDVQEPTEDVTIPEGSTGNREYLANFEPNGNTPYRIIYRIEDLDGNGYTEYESEDLTGTSDSEITPTPREYYGFETPASQTVVINPDGTTEIIYDYVRTEYELTYPDTTYIDLTNSTPEGSYKYETEITIVAVDREGYTFTGWSDGETDQTRTGPITDTLIAEPQYTANSYTIIYNANDEIATGTMDDQTVVYDTTVKLIKNVFEKLHYIFTGWYTNPDETGNYYNDEQEISNLSSTNNDEINLYASWQAETYTITFDKNNDDATGTMDSITKHFDEQFNLPDLGYWYTDHVLVEWNTSPDGTGTGYADKESVMNITDDYEITLYARWRDAEATFMQGLAFNQKVLALANDSYANITAVRQYTEVPDISNFTEDNIVSSSTSLDPIYAWYDNGTIYYWSMDSRPATNSDSARMFENFSKAEVIEVENFDTSNTTKFTRMFQLCSSVTHLDVDNWDTSSAIHMGAVFDRCSNLESIDVTGWDTDDVTAMYYMFSDCSKLTEIDVSHFNTSKVTDINTMFQNCSGLTALDISTFDTTKVTNMSHLFKGCSNLVDLNLGDDFNTSQVTNMFSMFNGCSKLTELDLSKFDTSKVGNMREMFRNMPGLTTLDLSTFDTSKVSNMLGMFAYCTNLESINFGNSFNTENVTTMGALFSYCKNLEALDLSGFNTSKVTDMNEMFIRCEAIKNIDISSFDTSKVTDFHDMFSICTELETVDLGSFKTDSATKMGSIFSDDNKLITIYVNSDFDDTYFRENTGNLFIRAYHIVGGQGTTFISASYEYAHIDGGPSNPGYFTDKGKYRIVFDKNDDEATGTMEDQMVVRNVQTAISENQFEKTGYHVVGWNTADDGTGTHYDPEEEVTDITDTPFITLYAEWEANTYTIIYNENEENVTGTMDNQTVVYDTTVNLIKNVFEKVHYIFTGWYTNPNGTGTHYEDEQQISNLSSTNNDEINLYASWQVKHYTIEFDKNSDEAEGTMESQEIAYEVRQTLSDNQYTRTGYKFGGWNTKSDLTGTHYDNKQEVVDLTENETITLYAEWGLTPYTVIFDKNADEATGTMANMSVAYGEWVSLTPNSYYRSKYAFNGWNSEPDGSGTHYDNQQVVINLDVDGNVTLYAEWIDAIAIFVPGQTFNATIKKLAGTNGAIYSTEDNNIQNFEYYTGTPDVSSFTDANIISTPDSLLPIYAWFDNGTIYWWTDAKEAYLNPDSSYMFNNIRSITSIDTESLDTSKVENMGYFFKDCRGLTELDINTFDTSNVTDMTRCFDTCSSLTELNLDINTSNVTKMEGTFEALTVTSLDLTNLDTHNVTDMTGILFGCRQLVDLDISTWDTSNVETFYYAFGQMDSIKELDLSSFDTSNAKKMQFMFCTDPELETIYVTEKFVVTQLNDDGRRMFDGSTNIVGGQGTTYVSNKINKDYAHIDGGSSNPGYLTDRNKFRIIFDKNHEDATGSMEDQMILRDTPTALLENQFIKTGFKFGGWNTKSDLEGLHYDDEQVVTNITTRPTLTLYAEWGVTPYTVVFDKNDDDATGSMESILKAYGEWFNIPSVGFEKYGYQFMGWNTEVDGSGKHFDDEERVINLDVDGQVTLYAQWREYVSVFDSGLNVNEKIKAIANAESGTITAIRRSANAPDVSIMTTDNIISTRTSADPIYAWYDEGTIYYYTDDPIPELNANADKMFINLADVTEIEVDTIDTSNTFTMRELFCGCKKLEEIDLSTWSFGKVQYSNSLFNGDSELKTIILGSNDEECKTTNLNDAWYGCSKLENLTIGIKFTNVNNMTRAFRGCGLETYDFTNFDTSKVTNMSEMFWSSKVKTIIWGDHFNTENVTNMTNMFRQCKNLEVLDLSGFSSAKLAGVTEMFRESPNIESITFGPNFTGEKITNMYYMFAGCNKLQELDLSNFKTDSLTSMPGAFNQCYSMTNINFGENFNTSQVTNMSSTFERCQKLTELDLSTFDTGNVTNFSHMFSYCSRLENIIGTIDLTNATSMAYMYYNCNKIKNVDLSYGTLENVVSMAETFSYCYDLESLQFNTNTNTSSLTSVFAMFRGCEHLTELDFTMFDTSKVTSMDVWFNGCTRLKTIYATDKITTDLVADTDTIFLYDGALVGGMGTRYDHNIVNKERAHIDGGSENPGYFTDKTKFRVVYDKNDDNATGTMNDQMIVRNTPTALSENLFTKEGYQVAGWNTEADGSGTHYDLEEEVTNITETPVITLYAEWEANTYSLVFHENAENVTGTMEPQTVIYDTVTNIIKNVFERVNYVFIGWNTKEDGTGTRFNDEQEILNLTSTDNEEIDLYVEWLETDAMFIPGQNVQRTMKLLSGQDPETIGSSNTIIKKIKRATEAPDLDNIEYEIVSTDASYYPIYMWFDETDSIIYYYSQADQIKLNPSAGGMFDGLSEVTEIDTGDFDTSYATTLANFFRNCSKLTTVDVTDFDTSNVTNMTSLFQSTKIPELDLSGWKTDKVTNMAGMFANNQMLTSLNISNFNTTNVTTMANMFDTCRGLTTLNVSSFDTSNVKDMTSMFKACSGLTALDVSNFNTSKVTSMQTMFGDWAWLTEGGTGVTELDLSNFDTSNVTTMHGMFNGCTNLTNVNMTGWNTSKVTNMSCMFQGCSSLVTFDVSELDTENVTTMASMFSNCTSLESIDISTFNTSKVTNMSSMFNLCTSLEEVNTTDVDFSKVQNMSSMFSRCSSLPELDVTEWDTGSATTMQAMFEGCISLATFDPSGWDTKNVTTFSNMFGGNNYNGRGCESLTSLDLSRWDTRKATNMSSMFTGCISLTDLDISGFETSNVTNMSSMFGGTQYKKGCESLTELDISSLDTSNVTNMANMFRGCKSLQSIDLSTVNSEKATTMSGIFCGCSSFTDIDVSPLVTNLVTDMSYMFAGCTSLTEIDLSTFNTDSLTNMSDMFQSCYSVVEIDLTPFVTTENTNMTRLFYDSRKLTTVYASSAYVPATGAYAPFFNTKIVGGKGTAYNDVNGHGIEYARLDEPENDSPGYFSDKTKFNIIYYKNGNTVTGEMTNQSVSANTDIQLNTNQFEKIGYAFGGWNTNPNGTGTHYDDGQVVRGRGLLRLYAQWGYTPYTVVFDKNADDATGSMADYQVGFGVHFNLPENTYSREGYRFAGWNNAPDGTGIHYDDMQAVVNLDIDGIATLYAEWVEIAATFDTGSNLNTKMRALLAETENDITLKRSNVAPDLTTMTSANIVSAANSNYPIYMWLEDDTLYWWSEVEKNFLNADCKNMFLNLPKIKRMNESEFLADRVTSMETMFRGSGFTSLDLSRWNTENVTTMFWMFYGCNGLTELDLRNLNTANVTTMTSMFYGCNQITDLDLESFDTQKVTDMASMFYGCSSLKTLDLSSFDPKNVKSITTMFWACSNLESIDFGDSFNTEKVTNMSNVFFGCGKLDALDLSSWNTSSVTTMEGMFERCGAKTIDLSSWNTINVVNMRRMFQFSKVTSLDLSNFNSNSLISMDNMFNQASGLSELVFGENFTASNVTNMTSTFAYTNIRTLDLSNFNTSNVKNMQSLFAASSNLESINLGEHFNTSNVTNMKEMFWCCRNLQSIDVTGFNTSKVTTMADMFEQCNKLTEIDLSSFDTSNVTNMYRMFCNCGRLETIYVKTYDISNVTNSTEMFIYAPNLIGGAGTKYNANHVDKEYAHIDGGTENPGYFTDKTKLSIVYYPNGENVTGEMENQLTEANTDITLNYNQYVQLGYAYGGWNTKPDGSGRFYENGETVNGYGTLRLYAQWGETPYTVIFDKNDDEATGTMDNMIVHYGEWITLPETGFTKPGYYLAGWNTKPDGTGRHYDDEAIVKNLDIDGEVTLYAEWAEKVAIFNQGVYVSPKIKALIADSEVESFAIKQSLVEPDESNKADENKVSFPTSPYPIYMWVEGENIYWWSEDLKPELHPNSRELFYELRKVTSIETDKIDTSKATDMRNLFGRSGVTELDLSSWDTSNVTTMSSMFNECAVTELDLSTFNTNKLTSMAGMFTGATNLTHVNFGDNFNTSKVTTMSQIFWKCSSLQSVEFGNGFDTSNVKGMDSMFQQCSNLTTISWGPSFNTDSANNMSRMFQQCSNLEAIDISRFNTSKVTSMFYMFGGCSKVESLTFGDNFDVRRVKDMRYMFNGCNSLHTLDLSGFKTEALTNMEYMFTSSANLETITFGPNFDTSKVDSFSFLFYRCLKLQSLDLSYWDTTNVTRTDVMFQECNNLASITFGPNFKCKKVTTTSQMFQNCTSLQSLDLSKFELDSVVNLGATFRGCSKIESITFGPNINTSNATTMASMFAGCAKLQSLDLSSFHTSNVTGMREMCNGCGSLQSITFGSNFDTSNVTNMGYMFYNCKSLNEIDISMFDASNVGYTDIMFQNCTSIVTIDLGSAFVTNSLVNTSQMFQGCSVLTTIYATGFDISNIENGDNMFRGCSVLAGGQGTRVTSEHMDAEYARVDDPDNDRPGYFTNRSEVSGFMMTFTPIEVDEPEEIVEEDLVVETISQIEESIVKNEDIKEKNKQSEFFTEEKTNNGNTVEDDRAEGEIVQNENPQEEVQIVDNEATIDETIIKDTSEPGIPDVEIDEPSIEDIVAETDAEHHSPQEEQTIDEEDKNLTEDNSQEKQTIDDESIVEKQDIEIQTEDNE